MSNETKTWNGLIHHRRWTLQKLSDCVKLFDENYEHIYRFSINEWKTIREQFIEVLNDKRA